MAAAVDNSWLLTVLCIGVSLMCCSASVEIEVGSEVKDRKEMDKWSNAMYIPEPTKTVTHEGNIMNWKFYARRKVPVYLQLWRPVGGSSLSTKRFMLVGQEFYEVKRTGLNIVSASKQILAKPGDVAGFLFTGESVVPYDFNECGRDSAPALYIKSPSAKSLREGGIYSFTQKQQAWRPCRSYSLKISVGFKGSLEFGRQTIDRDFLDGWKNTILIPEPHQTLGDGVLMSWRIYTRKAGDVYLQVWRHTGTGTEYELIGQTKYTVPSAGIHAIYARPLNVKNGDVIGFYYTAESLIPFDGRECSDQRGLYVKDPPSSKVKVGVRFHFDKKQSGWNPCRKYSITAVMILGKWTGEDPVARDDSDEWSNAMYIPNPDQPIKEAGYVYGWHFYSVKRNPISLMVFRPAPGINTYSLVSAESTMSEGNGLQHLGVKPIKVQEGDVLGFYFSKGSVVPFTGRECYSLGKRTLYVKNPSKLQLAVGKTFQFKRKISGWKPCRKYSFGALIGAAGNSAKRSLDENETKEEKISEDPLMKMLSSLV